MEFTYQNLRMISKEGTSIGKWKGINVFTCSESELKNMGNGAYYIIYDDDNKLVGKVGDTWYQYGIISKDSRVHECDVRKYVYCYDTESFEPAAPKTKDKAPEKKKVPQPAAPKTKDKAPEKKKVPQPAAREEVIGDVQMGLDVEETLKRARTMTVESLLEGFNYGLN